MLKLANQIIDVHDDVTQEGMKKLASINPDINVMGLDERAALKDNQFALSLITKKASKLNKFPIVDHDSTWLSNEYFDMSYSRLPEKAAEIAAGNIKLACGKYKVKPKESVERMAKRASDNVHVEQEPLKPVQRVEVANLEKFANAQQIGDNYTAAQYAFSNQTEVKLAAQYFKEKHEKMPLEVRHKYAAALQRRAKELGMSVLKEPVCKYASDHYSGLVDAHLRSRASLVEGGNPEYQMFLKKLASSKKDMTPTQFAKALHGFDKKAGLSGHYGASLTDPYMATFSKEPDPYEGYRIKTAKRDLTSDEVKNLVAVKSDRIKEYFGSTMLEELKKDPIPIFESLPDDAKEIMVGMIDDVV